MPSQADNIQPAGNGSPLSERRFIARGKTLQLGVRPIVMGIVNVTPDSFSDGGETADRSGAIERGIEMIRAGADIVDIGGESSRPGSNPVPLKEELNRVIPVIEGLRERLVSYKTEYPECTPVISIDTYKAEVARQALGAGADMINDISGGRFDPEMLAVTAQFGAGVCLMHIKGTPRDMQVNPVYNDVVGEVHDYLRTAVERFVAGGVSRDSILVDPGIGFGKTIEHNLILINQLHRLTGLGAGLLLGVSRKMFIGKLTGGLPPSQRVEGTIAANVIGWMSGADIFRVHDVPETVRALKVAQAIRNPLSIA